MPANASAILALVQDAAPNLIKDVPAAESTLAMVQALGPHIDSLSDAARSPAIADILTHVATALGGAAAGTAAAVLCAVLPRVVDDLTLQAVKIVDDTDKAPVPEP
uniref:Uncharacterized protein n=1 Tax=uncultured Caudovirales phage TaxID=2100421 RepID=A0A6J5L0Z4_9CAUD|nr:hypothetical protein UFOVP114_34 [uncultured Caudovirales phage]